MTKYNLLPYSIVVCVIVFVLLLIGYLYYSLYRYKLQAIENGLEDNEIIKEYSAKNGFVNRITNIISFVFTMVIMLFFVASVVSAKSDNLFPIKGVGTLQVVASGSMSVQHESNTYLAENNLTNQFDTFDIIGIQPKPRQSEIALYDVVVYKSSDKLIVHRIIATEQQNGQTYYVLRGDANNTDDIKPVGYDEIIGVYNNFRIPGAGIFVIFLQSTLGYVSMGLLLAFELIAPFFEKKIEKAIEERLKKIGYFT